MQLPTCRSRSPAHTIRTVRMKGGAYRGFVYVREEAVAAKRDLDYWVRLCLDFNKQAKSSRRRR